MRLKLIRKGLSEITFLVKLWALKSPQMIKEGGNESTMEEMSFELLCEWGIYMEQIVIRKGRRSGIRIFVATRDVNGLSCIYDLEIMKEVPPHEWLWPGLG